jgi:fatty-acyl-CoA synthase
LQRRCTEHNAYRSALSIAVTKGELTTVMNATRFREQVRERLLTNADKVLLRIVTTSESDQPLELTGAAIVEKAQAAAAQFRLQKERSVVLLLLPHSPELFLLHVGLILNGHVPAILAWPTSRVDGDKYQRNLVHQLSQLPADQLITLPRLAENLGGELPYAVAGYQIENSAHFEMLFPVGKVSQQLEAASANSSNTRPDPDTLFLQFSGGTTGAQKAIVVTAEMLSRQLQLLSDALGFTQNDSVVSWLPMYHDMGLIACLWLPLWSGAASLHIAANDWIMHPELLLKYVARYGATFSWLPNFAFAYLAQRREQMRQSYPLDSIRAWINCSEPVRLKSTMQFCEAFSDCGVRPDSMQACYAMAETVFAITQTPLGRAPYTVPRSRAHLGSRQYADLAFDLIDDVYASSGKPLAETEVRITSAEGTRCAEAVPGEIYVRTPSLFSGYWGANGFTTQTLTDTWHATGDFGFVMAGELFVIGRLKDIAIIGGQNIFPEDVEAVVNTIEGIYPGRVVAFGIEDQSYGTQTLAIIAEVRGEFEGDAALDLETAIRKLVLATVGIAPRYVTVVPQRWIVKSTAGKISRRETRERFIRERLTAIATEVV